MATMDIPRIDAHQHFWRLVRGDYGWITPETGVLYRDYGPEDLLPHLAAHGIQRTVLVQAAPTEAETDFMLGLAEEHAFIAGVVGWLDMEAPDFPERLAERRRNPHFVGVRPMIQDLPDERWMLRDPVLRAFAELERTGTAFDFLVLPQHLPHVLTVLERFPDLRCVIDHIAKPPIASGAMASGAHAPWAERLAAVAAHPGVHCKLSGMITEADHQRWRPEHLAPYIAHVLERFGPERVMFGSDWPVCRLAGEYDDVVRALRENLGGLSAAEEAAVFGGNAARFYGL